MNKWETLILLVIMVVGMYVLIAIIYYARIKAIEDQQLDDDLRTQYNTEDVITHYGLPCADPDCECTEWSW